MIDILLVCIGITALAIGAYTDIKILEVPDYLNYAVLAAAFGLRFIHSAATSEWMYLLHGAIGFGLFFIFGEVMYYSRQWGGGDTKMLRSLGVLFATYPGFLLGYFNPILNFYFPVVLLLNILIIGAVYGIVIAAVLAIKNWKEFRKEYSRALSRRRVLNRSVIVASIALLLVALLLPQRYMILCIAVAAIMFFTMQLSLFAAACEKSSMIRKIKTSRLREGDWIVSEIKKGKKTLYTPKAYGATRKEIRALVRNNVKTVVVKFGIPFVPAMLIAVMLTLVFGNFIFYIF